MDILCLGIAVVIAIYNCATKIMKENGTNYIEIKLPNLKKKTYLKYKKRRKKGDDTCDGRDENDDDY